MKVRDLFGRVTPLPLGGYLVRNFIFINGLRTVCVCKIL